MTIISESSDAIRSSTTAPAPLMFGSARQRCPAPATRRLRVAEASTRGVQ